MIVHETIPGNPLDTSPVPTWTCDAAGCPNRTPALHDAEGASRGRPYRPVEEGWWEHHLGVHLCPEHNPEEAE